MNVKDFAGVDSFYRDPNGKEISYHEYMRRIIGKLGLENIKSYIPFNMPTLKKAYKTSPHFNNLALSAWEMACGFDFTGPREVHITNGLCDLLKRNGITSYSSADCVCILKAAARELVKEEGK